MRAATRSAAPRRASSTGGADRLSRARPQGAGVLLVRLQAGVRPNRPTSYRPVQIARAAGRSPRAAEEAVTDHADRLLVRNGLDETVIVEAAAGTGKTTE